jgi:phytoene dehydrogenase-like protein
MEEIHMKPYDVAIIGGGISGLVAAIDLAMANKSVIVLEKSAQMGGRAITINKNGSRFNLGGHALYRSGEAYAILQQLNLKLEGGTPPSSGMGIWRNQLVPLPGDLLKLLSSRLLSMAGKIELGRLMLSLGKWDAAAIANISLREWSEQAISDPMVRHIFYALCRTATYSRDLDYQQAGSVVRQVQRSLKEGVLYLHGGWQTIVDQLRELAIRNGVAA